MYQVKSAAVSAEESADQSLRKKTTTKPPPKKWWEYIVKRYGIWTCVKWWSFEEDVDIAVFSQGVKYHIPEYAGYGLNFADNGFLFSCQK